MKCPCCGAALVEPPENLCRFLSPTQGRIYDLVRRSMPAGLDGSSILERIYMDGGPAAGVKVIHVTINLINHNIRQFGLRIVSKHGTYKILESSAEPANRKLTDEQIVAIGTSEDSHKVIAWKFGIHPNTVSRIKLRYKIRSAAVHIPITVDGVRV
jgi:hypothetical protein